MHEPYYMQTVISIATIIAIIIDPANIQREEEI